ncbi:hypothetical protein [Deinococcus sp.]|uniref:hypothetical protein n=1 Tax=Deinococcus sp. TaxID=47478 RepID=UPI0025BA2B26|nr:hypothetical protein [Deinococcus sp.]
MTKLAPRAYKALLYEFDERGVVTVTMNRPEHLNSVNMDMRRDFVEVMEELMFNNDVGLAIFNGAGAGFLGSGMGHFGHVVADIRIASETAKIGVGENFISLMPGLEG